VEGSQPGDGRRGRVALAAATLAIVGMMHAGPHGHAVVLAVLTPSSDREIGVEVSQLRNRRGAVRAALYDRAATWLQQSGARASCSGPAAGPIFRCSFGPIPPGQYAIAILHDEDGDGQMDRDWIGVPQEGYGFSNDAAVVLSAPGFGSAAFQHERADLTIPIRVRYGL
jgi:uncharacterized protein (DUF2141 family)